MKKLLSLVLTLCLLLTVSPLAFAAPQTSAVYELYSVDGYYEDSVGNAEEYSYHVPQFFSYAPAAEEINGEIAERFGRRIEHQMESMDGGYSLWSWHTEWKAYWNGAQLFLLITADENGGFKDYAAYGYDFETDKRVTNEMILEQLGISEEEYLENLREKTQLMFEDMCSKLSEEARSAVGYDTLLEKTLSWQNMDEQIYIDEFGNIITIAKIASIAGAEWYYHLVTPFAYG